MGGTAEVTSYFDNWPPWLRDIKDALFGIRLNNIGVSLDTGEPFAPIWRHVH